MEYISLLIFISIVAIIIAIGGKLAEKNSSHKERLPYYKKTYFLSFAESSFFKVLEKAVDDKYYIFPQVNLASLVRSNAQGRAWWGYFRKISQKSVDYVLTDKKTCNPLLIIELDDSTHKQEERQERDGFVDEVLKAAEIPILHVNYKNGYSLIQLQQEIEDILTNINSEKAPQISDH